MLGGNRPPILCQSARPQLSSPSLRHPRARPSAQPDPKARPAAVKRFGDNGVDGRLRSPAPSRPESLRVARVAPGPLSSRHRPNDHPGLRSAKLPPTQRSWARGLQR